MSQDMDNEVGEYLNDSVDSPKKNYDIKELFKKIEKNDKEIQVLTEALKTTLSDVRIVMQDIDNPFNLLKKMGVDNLMDQAVEKVADGVKKAKREFDTKKSVEDNIQTDQSKVVMSTRISDYATESDIENFEKKIIELENKINIIIKHLENSERNKINNENKPSTNENGHNYSIYVSLLSDYFFIKYGEKKSKEILLSALYKGWGSSNLIRDIMINVDEKDVNIFSSNITKYNYEWNNESSEEKTLIITLLNKIEKIKNENDPSLILFLLNLINTTKEHTRVKDSAQ
jgi:hypothetical protein